MSESDRRPIRHAYERHGVKGSYKQFGAHYRYPHEPAIRAALLKGLARWQVN